MRVGIVSAFLLPSFLFAAYNDVTLTTDTVITVADINLNISGSSAVVQSITVNPGNFSVVLLNNSTITVSSADKRVMSIDVSKNYTTSTSCTSSASVTTFASSDTNAVTMTVTPTANTCTIPSTPTSSSGRSGSGVTSSTLVVKPAIPTVPSVTTVAEIQALIAQLTAQISALQGNPSPQAFANASSNASFKRSLNLGLSGEDVRSLQKFLNGQGFVVSVSGAGSLDNETVFFGALTKAALIKFQIANGIEGIGIMGPLTRAKIEALSK